MRQVYHKDTSFCSSRIDPKKRISHILSMYNGLLGVSRTDLRQHTFENYFRKFKYACVFEPTKNKNPEVIFLLCVAIKLQGVKLFYGSLIQCTTLHKNFDGFVGFQNTKATRDVRTFQNPNTGLVISVVFVVLARNVSVCSRIA